MSLKIAVLGAGRIGQVHARSVAMSPVAELVAVADAFPDAAQRAVDQFGGRVDSVDALIADPGVDAVIICTPTDTHAALIEQAARGCRSGCR